MAKVILGMTTSLDGFIADQKGRVGRLYSDLAALRGTAYMNDLIEETGAVVLRVRWMAHSFGVEVTELYPSEVDARLDQIPGDFQSVGRGIQTRPGHKGKVVVDRIDRECDGRPYGRPFATERRKTPTSSFGAGVDLWIDR